jgi:predicted nucleic acid-binding protein
MRGRWVYLDSSAFVRLILVEAGSTELREYLRRRPRRASSALLLSEAMRVLRRFGTRYAANAQLAMSEMELIRVSPRLLEMAGRLDPPELRTLDAIHVASAMSLGTDLGAVVAFDDRMLAAADANGLPVARL